MSGSAREREQLDVAVVGGVVVTGAGMRRADVGVHSGRVAVVGDLAHTTARRRIDATGSYVLPGAVDEHVHPVYLDDPARTARVAARGGTTTVMHFAYAKPGTRLDDAARAMIADSEQGVLDFAIHAGIFDAAVQLDDVERTAALGVRSFKMFLTYMALGWMTDDYQLLRAMERIAAVGGLAMVHAENGPAIEYLESRAQEAPRDGDDVARWLGTRPDVLEAEGVYRAIAMAEVSGCPLWIPHVTCRRALEVVRWARGRGLPVVAETCPHYLALTSAALDDRGALAKVGPPLRTDDDVEALWEGLRDGTLSAIGSDHAPKKRADDGGAPLLEAGFGAPAAETLMTIVHDAGVVPGRISLVEMVRAVAEHPARIFGLYPRKGAIAPGSDADLVVWDPAREIVLDERDGRSEAGYSLYHGRRCLGAPRLVLRRGETLLSDGEEHDPATRGEHLPTGPFDLLVPAGATAGAHALPPAPATAGRAGGGTDVGGALAA
ncbi:amidohydrolase family protein [Conexibacter sp. CPCC 206217]|uniref:amidohydrolase family protein n=1 Tax=Conexibacter sp. CPCC 206217 TaxID=3064574 RepID=UPI002722CCDC|nr:amidohydrolase family protein [Conexibacter sp. CPCC 206217]MDO8210160.1 amidohydrolase family protein [Conexibacter sp. CPCC 206217]